MKVVFSSAAEQDLRDLFSYIGNELHNQIAARNIATKILRRAQSLATFPEMGASLENIDHRLKDYRYLLVDNYLLTYQITNSNTHVVRILFARSDYVQLLQG